MGYIGKTIRMVATVLGQFALILGVFVVGSLTAQADQRLYDQNGTYKGRIDDNGRMYDQHGQYRGKITESGTGRQKSPMEEWADLPWGVRWGLGPEGAQDYQARQEKYNELQDLRLRLEIERLRGQLEPRNTPTRAGESSYDPSRASSRNEGQSCGYSGECRGSMLCKDGYCAQR